MSNPAGHDASSALIGYTGFVGSTLLKQRSFDACFNSANIDQIAGRSFDLVCLFDVLEHIEEDVTTLAAVATLLARGGHALVTVPAYSTLGSTGSSRTTRAVPSSAIPVVISCQAPPKLSVL